MESLTSKYNNHKLIISFLLIIVLFLSSGIFTIKGLFTLGNLTRTIYDHVDCLKRLPEQCRFGH